VSVRTSPKSPIAAPAALARAWLAAIAVSGAAHAEPRTLTLREAIGLAERAAPAAVDARLQRDVQASQADAAALPGLQNPNVETGVERGRFYDDVVAYGQLILRVEVSGQRSARMREVDDLVRAREARVKATTAEAAASVAEAFGAVLAARERVLEVGRGLAAANDELRIHAARAAAGDATLVDVAYAEAEAGRWRQLLRSSEMGVVAAKARLAQLVGVPEVDVRGEIAPPAAAPAGSTPGAAGEAAKLPPAALAFEAESAAARASAERARREGYPTLDFGPRFTRGDFGELRSALVVGGALPIVRRNQAEVARAEAEAVRASRLKEVVTANAAVRAKAAFDRVALAREALVDLEGQAIPAAERAVSAAQEAFRAGKGDFFRILLARRDLVTTRLRRLEVVEAAWAAYAELLAVGVVEP
jgi:cobalt-zinc-cadmium efflux system outer membrane protein